METKDAMKAVINASTARTGNTFANTDLIQLYDNNGNPIYKISKSDFMSAVYNYLTSSSVASNLASVLGGVKYQKAVNSSDNMDEMREQGSYTMNGVSSQPANFPDNTISSCVIIVFLCYNWNVQLVISATKFIYRFGTSISWNPWKNLN